MKRIRLVLIVFLTILFADGVCGQNKLQGVVVDSLRNPVDFATVLVMHQRDSSIVTGVVSDEHGRFVAPNLVSDDYIIRISHMSYDRKLVFVSVRDNMLMDTVFMGNSNISIEEIKVKGNFTRWKANGYEVSMIGNPIAEGKSAIGILGLLPGVTLFNGLRINGLKGTVVHINGRKVMDMRELGVIPAKYIDKVEVIPVAGASYDSDYKGGVINIKLRKLAEMGIVGSVGGNMSVNKDGIANWNVDVPFSMRYKKWSIYNFMNVSGFYFNERDKNERIYRDSPDNITSYSVSKPRSHSFSDNLSLVYDITTKHSVGLNLRVSLSDSKPYSRNSSVHRTMSDTLDSYYISHGNTGNDVYQAAFNYTWDIGDNGSNIKFVADYIRQNNRQNNDNYYWYQTHSDPLESEMKNILRNNSDMFETELKAEIKLGSKTELNTGARYYLRDVSRKAHYSQLQDAFWVMDDRYGDDSRYKGDGAACYVEVYSSAGNFSYGAGIRGQYERMSYESRKIGSTNHKNYVRLLPNANISYAFNQEKGTILSLSYSRSMDRIPYRYITPEVTFNNEYSYEVGNLDIRPSSDHILQLSFVLNGKLSLAYTYMYSKDEMHYLQFEDRDNPLVHYTKPVNIGTSSYNGLSASMPVKITKWWNMKGDANIGSEFQKFLDKQTRNLRVGVSLSNNFRIMSGWGADFSLNYEKSYRTYNTKYHWVMYSLLGMHKYFLKGKLLVWANYTLSYRQRITTYYGDTYKESDYNTSHLNRVSFGVKYNFKSGGKSNVRVKQSSSIQSAEQEKPINQSH